MYDRSDVYFSFLYFVLVLCFILPPKEFVSAGLTIQNMFSFYLGSEDLDFIGYHLKRTTVTPTVHLFFPLVYYIGLGLVSPEYQLLNFAQLASWGVLFALICFSCAVAGVFLFFIWSHDKWRYHPLAKDLLKFASHWGVVGSQINTEFRRLEKFSSVNSGTSIYVTDSWIIKCTSYKVYISHQTDSYLSVLKSEEFSGADGSGQYIHINVSSIAPHQQSFQMSLNSLEYNELKDRLRSPIRNARNVVIHQTLSDRFIEAFREQVLANGRLEGQTFVINELEGCIGCMQKPGNIKLSKKCSSTSIDGCQQCYCRPMWCLECMGRWFASRQDQQQPEQWMSSISPCPTCRTKFCLLDVFKVD